MNRWINGGHDSFCSIILTITIIGRSEPLDKYHIITLVFLCYLNIIELRIRFEWIKL